MRTAFKSDRILNTYRGTNDTAAATIYCSLLTAVTDAEAGTVTEAAWGAYARVAAAFGAPASALGGRQIVNSAPVTFPAKSDAGQVPVIAVGCHDALSGGNLTDIIYLDGADPILFIGNDVPTDFLRSPAHGLSNDQQVRLEVVPGAGSLPTGLSEGTTYFVVSATADDFKLSLTQGGAAVNVTAQGRGLLHRLTPKIVDQNDQANFAIGTLKLADD